MIMRERVILSFQVRTKKYVVICIFWHLKLILYPFSSQQKLARCFKNLPFANQTCPRSFLEQRSSWIILNHPWIILTWDAKRAMPFTFDQRNGAFWAPLLPKISSMRPSFVNGSPEGMTCERWQGETQGMPGHKKRKQEIWCIKTTQRHADCNDGLNWIEWDYTAFFDTATMPVPKWDLKSSQAGSVQSIISLMGGLDAWHYLQLFPEPPGLKKDART